AGDDGRDPLGGATLGTAEAEANRPDRLLAAGAEPAHPATTRRTATRMAVRESRADKREMDIECLTW
ncbi:MAG: hypothetical protein ACYDCI_02465, partial [Candidatus Limnocylindrales bacterium]